MCELIDLAGIICPEDNLGGIQGDIYTIPVDDIDETSLPTLDPTDGVTLVGNIVPKSGKRFSKLYQTKGKGKLDYTTVGERDGKSFENVIEFFVPGTKKEIAVFSHRVQNLPVVAIVNEGGNQRVVGITVLNNQVSLGLPAYLETGSGATGAASSDLKGSTFNFKAEATRPPLYYEGNIPIVAVP